MLKIIIRENNQNPPEPMVEIPKESIDMLNRIANGLQEYEDGEMRKVGDIYSAALLMLGVRRYDA